MVDPSLFASPTRRLVRSRTGWVGSGVVGWVGGWVGSGVVGWVGVVGGRVGYLCREI